MSNNVEEYLMQIIQELQNDLAKAKQRIIELEVRASKATSRADILEKTVARLKDAIEDLEREKWSFQSELENLRGW